MVNFIFYVVIAAAAAFVFKMIVGIGFSLLGLLIMLLLGFKERRIELLIVKHPKVFVTYGTLANAIIGVVYSFIIFLVSSYFIYVRGGPYWLYVILSFIWAFTLINGAQSFHGTLLASCFGSLLLFYLGFLIFAPIVAWILVTIGALFYGYGRADMLREQMIQSGDYQQLLQELGEA